MRTNRPDPTEERIRRWRAREDERLARERERQSRPSRWRRRKPKAQTYQGRIAYPGVGQLGPRFAPRLDPVLCLAALIVLIEVAVAGFGTWRDMEDGYAFVAPNPVRQEVIDRFAFRTYRPDVAETELGRLARTATNADLQELCRDEPKALEARCGPFRAAEAAIAPGANPWKVFEKPDPARQFASVFLHGSILHAALNTLFFVLLAPFAAARMGAGRFLVFFAATGMAGNALFWLVNAASWMGYPLGGHHPFVPVVGASGAVFGLLAVILRRRWHRADVQGAPWTTFGPVPWLVRHEFWLVLLTVFLSYFGSLAWQAHLGGFAAGWLLAPWLRRSPRAFRDVLVRVNRPPGGGPPALGAPPRSSPPEAPSRSDRPPS